LYSMFVDQSQLQAILMNMHFCISSISAGIVLFIAVYLCAYNAVSGLHICCHMFT